MRSSRFGMDVASSFRLFTGELIQAWNSDSETPHNPHLSVNGHMSYGTAKSENHPLETQMINAVLTSCSDIGNCNCRQRPRSYIGVKDKIPVKETAQDS